MFLLTGLRKQEVMYLFWSDINREVPASLHDSVCP
jgi:hypothetical protein